MPLSLLMTKLFFPPVHRDFVPRPHWLERLGAGLRGPRTLFCVPTGYGKTSLCRTILALSRVIDAFRSPHP